MEASLNINQIGTINEWLKNIKKQQPASVLRAAAF